MHSAKPGPICLAREVARMSKDDQITNQAELIARLNAENASLKRRCKHLQRGQAYLRNLLSPDIEPTTTDEWAAMIERARAELEAEDGQQA